MTDLCQAPDPRPRTPKLKTPPHACDCHAHIFGPAARYPFAGGRSYTPPEASLESYRHVLATLGIDRAVIVQPSVYGTDNRATLDAMVALGGAARGIAVVDPEVSDRDLDAMHEVGMRGVRLNLLFGAGLPLATMDRLAPRLAARGWHLQFLMDLRTLPDLAGKLSALPVDVVVDHMGHMPTDRGLDDPGFQALLGMMAAGRCWAKLSGNYRVSVAGPPYADAVPFAQALIAAAPDGVVWGTDWPHPAVTGPMPNDGDLLDALADYTSDSAQVRAILVDNPARLYGFAES